jgi:hypothetical protein
MDPQLMTKNSSGKAKGIFKIISIHVNNDFAFQNLINEFI